MTHRPTLTTKRLILRPFALSDAHTVQRLAGDRKIAATTLNIPHPYEDGVAEAWIESQQEQFERGELVSFAVVLGERTGDSLIETALVGSIGLHISQKHARAELGYWIGVPYWNQGYCTEAARAVVRYGIQTLGLNRIQSRHLVRNPASGRVMQKIGMRYEGTMRQAVLKWEVFEDVNLYAVLKDEYVAV
jgi:RimJ/RimL family protein N-acetyltransferase